MSLGLTLFGCGGPQPAPARSEAAPEAEKRPPETKAAATPPSTPSDTRPVIVAFGDSLSAGYGADPGKSFPISYRKIWMRPGCTGTW